MNMNNKNWVSVWGNAVSIAEHHPEAYAKYITLHYVILYTFHLTETLSALHLIISAEARPLLSQEPLFLQPLPLFMKKCRSPVHAKRKRSATSLFQKTSP